MNKIRVKQIFIFVLLVISFIIVGCNKSDVKLSGTYVTSFDQDNIQLRIKFKHDTYEYSIIKSYEDTIRIIYQEIGALSYKTKSSNEEGMVEFTTETKKVYDNVYKELILKNENSKQYEIKFENSTKLNLTNKSGVVFEYTKQNIVLSIVLVVIGGLGIFLLGMNYMSNGLQTVAGDKLKWLVNKVANNRVFATIIGTFITVIIQSSSITTVMVVGFVNAGIMTLKQSIGIIMGANIGTTITGWVLIVNIGKFGLPIIGVAALVSLFVKKDKIKYVATIIMGLGMIFFGLQLMTDGFAPIRDIPEFVSYFQIFSATTYFGVLKCILLGAVLTMVVQSSSATLGITIGLAITGVIPFQTAAALVLGENIGTTITAYLASLGANTAAKRAAYAHIIFNIFGGVWVFSIFPFYINFIEILANDGSVGKKIALTHTMFNVLNVLVFLPFVGYFAKFLEKIVPEEKEVSIKLTKLDERMFETPILVIDQSKREIINMGLILQDMFETLREVIVKDYDKNHPQVRKIFNEEANLDVIQKEISGFLIKVFNTDLSVPNVIKARKYLSLCDEYESISDYIMNISKLRLKLLDNKLNLSEEKKRDMLSMQDKVLEYFNTVNSYFIMDKTNIMPKSIEMNKNTIDYFKKLREIHHERLSQCQVEPLLSTSYMDILNAYRRMKDHIFDITEIISGEKLV